MLRTSSYTIYVDLPDHSDEMLLVHGYTGAHDRVSKRVAQFLRAHDRRPPKPLYGEWVEEPATAEGTTVSLPDEVITTLEHRGYVTRLDRAAEEQFFARLAVKLHDRARRQPPSYVFMPTYDCNLRCGYCFQDHMRTNDDFRHLLHPMTPAMVDRIFGAIPNIEAAHDVDASMPRLVGFFGGEPLLESNRPIVDHIIARANALGPASFWAVTNGTELHAYRDRLVPGHLDRLQITIDGPPEEHDKRRIRADGGGTFDRIAENVTMALDQGVTISVRLNVDRNNVDQLPAVAQAFEQLGWHHYANFSAYTAPIHAANDHTDRATTFNSWQLDQAIDALRRDDPTMRLVGRPDEGIRHRARALFANGETVQPQLRPSFCGAHDQMYLFDPFGDVYACWERTGDARIRIAHIDADHKVTYDQPVNESWRTRNVASNPVCRQCRYALHCGGGCAILALGQRGTMHANFCDGFASRFRASIAEAYLAHVADEPVTAAQAALCDL